MPFLNNRGQLWFNLLGIITIIVGIVFFGSLIYKVSINIKQTHCLTDYNPAMHQCLEWKTLDNPKIQHNVTSYYIDGNVVNEIIYSDISNIDYNKEIVKRIDEQTLVYKLCSEKKFKQYNKSIHKCTNTLEFNITKGEKMAWFDIKPLTEWGIVYFTKNNSENKIYNSNNEYKIMDMNYNSGHWLFLYEEISAIQRTIIATKDYNISICTEWEYIPSYNTYQQIFITNKYNNCMDNISESTCVTFDYLKQDDIEIKFNSNKLCVCGNNE